MATNTGDLAHEEVRGLPLVSIIIPAYNEESYLGRCLESLKRQTYPGGRVEVIVVDNGSTDTTPAIARGHGAHLEIDTEARVGGLRNHGVRISRGSVLAFLDADCVAPPTWIGSAVAELADDETLGAIGGNYLVEDGASWIEKVWAVRPVTRRQRVPYLAAGDLILRRKTFEDLGGFDKSLHAGEDEEFCSRLRATGLTIAKTPACSVIHLGYPKTLREVLTREMWHGSSQVEAANTVLDRALLAVHLFALALILLGLRPILGAVGTITAMTGLVIVTGLPALAAVQRKTSAQGFAEKIRHACQLWPVYFVYFVGRTLGLVINYKRILTRRDTRVRRTK
jgi:GT2 family glycosyltransferase